MSSAFALVFVHGSFASSFCRVSGTAVVIVNEEQVIKKMNKARRASWESQVEITWVRKWDLPERSESYFGVLGEFLLLQNICWTVQVFHIPLSLFTWLHFRRTCPFSTMILILYSVHHSPSLQRAAWAFGDAQLMGASLSAAFVPFPRCFFHLLDRKVKHPYAFILAPHAARPHMGCCGWHGTPSLPNSI